MERICKCCGEIKSIDQFANAGTIKGVRYYRHRCILCYSKQKLNESSVRMQKFREYKKTLKCNRCGYNDYRALEFHHYNDDKDQYEPCQIARFRSWENVLKELSKCEVLCSNCHRIEHFKE